MIAGYFLVVVCRFSIFITFAGRMPLVGRAEERQVSEH